MPLEPSRGASSLFGPGDRLPWSIAFISDPHGDRVALDRVISDLEGAEPVDEVLVGGDLAEGGAQPVEVIDEIRKRGWPSVRGNGDDLLVRIADGYPAAEAVRVGQKAHGVLPESVATHAEWSVGRLGPERIDYLRSLPMSIVRGPFAFGTVVLVHAHHGARRMSFSPMRIRKSQNGWFERRRGAFLYTATYIRRISEGLATPH